MFKMIKFATVGVATLFAAIALPGASASAMDRHILLVNNSHYVITEFHASNVGRTSWESDILGDDVLGAGEIARINLDDNSGYCRFDFLTVFADGERVIRRNVDACTIDRYTIND